MIFIVPAIFICKITHYEAKLTFGDVENSDYISELFYIKNIVGK